MQAPLHLLLGSVAIDAVRFEDRLDLALEELNLLGCERWLRRLGCGGVQNRHGQGEACQEKRSSAQ
jgi:hypothetical protein